jgi:hypothetical protein
VEAALPITVVQYNIEATGHRDYELMERFVCMPASVGATRNVVEVIYSFDIKWHVA